MNFFVYQICRGKFVQTGCFESFEKAMRSRRRLNQAAARSLGIPLATFTLRHFRTEGWSVVSADGELDGKLVAVV